MFSLRALVAGSALPEHRRALLLAMLEDNRFGTELYSSTLRLAVRIGRSYCTVQRRLHKLVREDKVLVMVRAANEPAALHNGEFRPTNTYRIAVENLQPRETVEQWESRMRPYAKHKGRRPSIRTSEPVAAAPAAPVQVETPEHPQQYQRPQRTLRSHEATRVIAKMRELMRGQGESPGRTQPNPDCPKCRGTGFYPHLGHPGQEVRCCWNPPDPHYRAPMSQANALIAACLHVGVRPEDAQNYLKLFPQALVEGKS